MASTLPFQVVYRIFTGKMPDGDIFGFLNLLRLWRLRRVSELFHKVPLTLMFVAKIHSTVMRYSHLAINITIVLTPESGKDYSYDVGHLFCVFRLEKDTRFSYFWTRYCKLIGVSISYLEGWVFSWVPPFSTWIFIWMTILPGGFLCRSPYLQFIQLVVSITG